MDQAFTKKWFIAAGGITFIPLIGFAIWLMWVNRSVRLLENAILRFQIHASGLLALADKDPIYDLLRSSQQNPYAPENLREIPEDVVRQAVKEGLLEKARQLRVIELAIKDGIMQPHSKDSYRQNLVAATDAAKFFGFNCPWKDLFAIVNPSLLAARTQAFDPMI